MTDTEFTIRPVQYCRAVTKSGKRCDCRIQEGQYCHLHAQLFRFPKPDECPVCTCPLTDPQPLSCGHWVHRECVLKWGKDQCPVCRSKIRMTKKELDILGKNKSKPSSGDIEFDEQAIAALIRRDMEARGMAIDAMTSEQMDEEMDALSTLVVGQIIQDLTRTLTSSSGHFSGVYPTFPFTW